MGNAEHNMSGLTSRRDRIENKIINKQENIIPRNKKIEMAKTTMEEKFKTEDGLVLKKIAQELLERYKNVSIIDSLSDNELENEVGKYGTPEELVAACEWIEDEEKRIDDAKWDKYKDF